MGVPPRYASAVLRLRDKAQLNVTCQFGFFLDQQFMQNYSTVWLDFRFEPISAMRDVVVPVL